MVTVKILGNEVLTYEEKKEMIKNFKIQEFLDSSALHKIKFLENISTFKQSSVNKALIDNQNINIFSVLKNSILIHTNKISQIVNHIYDQTIVDHICDHEHKDLMIVKKYSDINYTDLILDHVLTVIVAPVINVFILFKNYIFITKPFLKTFEEECEFTQGFANSILNRSTRIFIIKDY